MSYALPFDSSDHAFNAIEVLVEAFRDLLDASGIAVVCRYIPTGDIIAVGHYTDLMPAMIATWRNNADDTSAELHATVPLISPEAGEWD